jgi:hypothetical protein
MDFHPFRPQIPGMGQSIHNSRCPHCGSPAPRDRDRLGRFECAKCDRFDPFKSGQAKGWLQGELQPPK